MTEREENRRILAEWVYGPWDESRCRICGWTLKQNIKDGCIAISCSLRPPPARRADEPPDFYANESANATLIEKGRMAVIPEDDGWRAGQQFMHGAISMWRPGHIFNRDRKAAIVAAALLIARPQP